MLSPVDLSELLIEHKIEESKLPEQIKQRIDSESGK